jgi:glycosyltransferase involved in cell wall biosynthesis
VAASPPLRERLAKGAAGLSNLFSWEGIAQNTMKVYEEVLAARA